MKHIHNKDLNFYLTQAKLYLDNCEKSDRYYDEDEQCVHDYLSEDNPTIECGMSKVVIVFDNKDYVIKIPLRGKQKVLAFKKENSSYGTDRSENTELCSDDMEEYSYQEEFIDYSHAKRDEFFNSKNNWDYCELESHLGQEAEKEGLEDIFLPTIFLGIYNNVPIYIQEKAHIIGVPELPSEESISRYQSIEFEFEGLIALHDEEFGTFMLDYYGEEKLQKFSSFLEKYSIKDLHRGNIGFILNRPVLIDYCGFHN